MRSYMFAIQWIARMHTPKDTEAMLIKFTADLFELAAINVAGDVNRYRKSTDYDSGSLLGEYLNRKD